MTVVLLAQNKANYKSIIEEKSGCPGNNTFISFVSKLFLSHGANGTLQSDTTFISPFRIGLVKATKSRVDFLTMITKMHNTAVKNGQKGSK